MSSQAKTCLGKNIPRRGNQGARVSWKTGVAEAQGRMRKRCMNCMERDSDQILQPCLRKMEHLFIVPQEKQVI